jgi:hypothetical protein
MLKGLVGFAVLAAGAALAASPASALPVDRSIAAEAGGSQATEIAWVCNRRGRRCRWVAPGVWVGPPVWGAPGILFRPPLRVGACRSGWDQSSRASAPVAWTSAFFNAGHALSTMRGRTTEPRTGGLTC